MEDENGIELSLGLSFGGSAGKSKGKDGSSLDIKAEEGGNNNKLTGDLKNFLTGIQHQGSDSGSQRSDTAHSGTQTLQENFFTSLAKSAPISDVSMDLREEVKSDHQNNGDSLWPEAGNKRKMLFEEIMLQKRHEREVQHADSHCKNRPMGVINSVKTSHVSVTAEDGSTAENEDVAESEVEGSTSRLVLHHKDSTKHYMGRGDSSEVAKESHGFTNMSVIEFQGKKQSNVPPGNESNIGNLTYGTPLPRMTVSHPLSMKVPNVTTEPNASGFPSPCPVQLMPPANGEGPGAQSMNPGNLPLTFGYSPLQLPRLDTDHSWGLISHRHQLPTSCAGRSIGSVVPNSDKSEGGLKISPAVIQASSLSSEALPDERKASESAKGGGKQNATEEGGTCPSSQTEDEMKGNNVILGLKEAYHQQGLEGFSHEVLAIRPGIAADLKFGGCGSYPDLPWVSTTGLGPNGRTISGVTYRYDRHQIRIVCACHGSHMSPEEFVQHASADVQNQENNTGLPPFPSSNSLASTQN